MSTTLTMDQQAPAETTPATSTAIPYPEVQMRDQPTDKAIERADQFNYMRLAKHLRYGGFENAQAFLDNNFDALYANFRGLAQSMDIIQERLNPDETQLRKRLNSADPAVVKAAKKQIDKNSAEIKKARRNTVQLAIYALERYQNDPALLDTRLGNKGWTTPLDEQFKMDKKAAYDERAKANLKRSFGKAGAVFHQGWKATSALATGLYHAYEVPVHLLSAYADKKQWSKTHRNLIFSSWIGILTLAPALPLPAAWLESAPASGVALTGAAMASPTDGSPLRSCAVRDMFPQGMHTASFELGMNSKDPVKQAHYVSAMRGALVGVSPAAMYAVSSFETFGFRDSVADNSNASGAYQTIPATKLHMLAKYAKDTPTYREINARVVAGTASDDDRTFITAVDTTIEKYMKDRDGTIESVEKRRMDVNLLNAVQAADRPAFSGDLMAAYINDEAPYLTIKSLEGKSNAEFVNAIARYYQTHLMGPGGGAFFRHVVRQSPQMRINDRISIKQSYKAYNPGNEGTANYYSGYYTSVRGRNPAIFTNSPALTFGQVSIRINNVMDHTAKPVFRGMEKGTEQAQAQVENCLELQARGQNLDRTSIAAAKTPEDLGPAYRSMYSVAWERAGNAYVANTSAGFRNGVSSVATTASSTFAKVTRSLSSSSSAPASPAPRQQLQVNWQSQPN